MKKDLIASDYDETFTARRKAWNKGMRTKLVEKQCKICNVIFKVDGSEKERHVTCGKKECRKMIKIGNNNPHWNSTIIRNCIDCGRKITRISAKRCKSCSHKGKLNCRWKGEENKRLVKRLSNRRRKLKIKGIKGSHLQEEWDKLKKTYYYMCLCCKRKEPEIKLTRDHIIPLDKGGTDYIWNIQPLCGSCNSIKHTKEIDYREKVYVN